MQSTIGDNQSVGKEEAGRESETHEQVTGSRSSSMRTCGW